MGEEDKWLLNYRVCLGTLMFKRYWMPHMNIKKPSAIKAPICPQTQGGGWADGPLSSAL